MNWSIFFWYPPPGSFQWKVFPDAYHTFQIYAVFPRLTSFITAYQFWFSPPYQQPSTSQKQPQYKKKPHKNTRTCNPKYEKFFSHTPIYTRRTQTTQIYVVSRCIPIHRAKIISPEPVLSQFFWFYFLFLICSSTLFFFIIIFYSIIFTLDFQFLFDFFFDFFFYFTFFLICFSLFPFHLSLIHRSV